MAGVTRITEWKERDDRGKSRELTVDEAIEARDQLLREQPHLQDLQDEIDRILQKVIGTENRMAVLGLLLEAKIYQLKEAVALLRPTTPEESRDRAASENVRESFDAAVKRRLH